MPVYVYRNLRTGDTFELEQRITEPPLTSHPESGDPVKRLIQPVGIAFKGSGFYVTDTRKGGSGKAEAGSKSESKPESKPVASTESKSTGGSSSSD